MSEFEYNTWRKHYIFHFRFFLLVFKTEICVHCCYPVNYFESRQTLLTSPFTDVLLHVLHDWFLPFARLLRYFGWIRQCHWLPEHLLVSSEPKAETAYLFNDTLKLYIYIYFLNSWLRSKTTLFWRLLQQAAVASLLSYDSDLFFRPPGGIISLWFFLKKHLGARSISLECIYIPFKDLDLGLITL